MESKMKMMDFPKEDLSASRGTDTTIDVEMNRDDWADLAAEKVKAAEGSDYVKLDHGVLTVDQINYILKTLPMRMLIVDDNNQFIYYNGKGTKNEMPSGKQPGYSLEAIHQEKSLKYVEKTIQVLRSGMKDIIRVPSSSNGPDEFVVENYQAMRDVEGNFRGINEYILDIKPIVDWYLKKTGQRIEESDKQTDATASASTTKDDIIE